MSCMKFYTEVRIFTPDNRIYKSIKTKCLSHLSQDIHQLYKIL